MCQLPGRVQTFSLGDPPALVPHPPHGGPHHTRIPHPLHMFKLVPLGLDQPPFDWLEGGRLSLD